MNGRDLKVKRVEAGLKQYRVAAALGIPQATLSYYENERRPTPPEMEGRILATIGNSRMDGSSTRRGKRPRPPGCREDKGHWRQRR